MRADIVIGANFGDEGKGLTVNALTEGKNTLVILTNGGAQRGHTVVENGIRHIFHHFGSGSLKGAASYFCEDFIVNPVEFCKEWEELSLQLSGKTIDMPTCYADENCRVSTIFDMIGNCLRNLDNGLNDSTGFGIYETINRYNADSSFKYLGELLKLNSYGIKQELSKISKYYLIMYKKLYETSNNDKVKFFYNLLSDPKLIENNWVDIDTFKFYVEIKPLSETVKSYSQIIFEQGQGLGLDNDTDIDFGTPSKTNSYLPIKYLTELNIKEANRYYITRSYITRHGDGNLTDENKDIKLDDKTNVHNDFQGSIRYAPFTENNINNFMNRVAYDMNKTFDLPIKFNNNIVMTHYKPENEQLLLRFGVFLGINNLFYSDDEEKPLKISEKAKSIIKIIV